MCSRGRTQTSALPRCLGTVRLRLGAVLGLLAATTAACASKDDVTPTIVVSPGAKERIMMMDRLRHYGSPRRLLPKVTVEEVDEAELPPPPAEEGSATEDESIQGSAPTDAGASDLSRAR
jgi:hypothetical protein